MVTTVSGAVKDAVDWTKNKINDITDGVKKAAIKAKEAVVEAWNRTIKKAIPAVGKFVNETVWKKWIVGGVWETFCKNVAWQMVLSEINRCVCSVELEKPGVRKLSYACFIAIPMIACNLPYVL